MDSYGSRTLPSHLILPVPCSMYPLYHTHSPPSPPPPHLTLLPSPFQIFKPSHGKEMRATEGPCRSIYLGPIRKIELLANLQSDVEWLRQHNIMDYVRAHCSRD